MAAREAGETARDEVHDRGPGPFVTHRLRRHPGGGYVVAHSRRHRKGLRPQLVADAESAEHPSPVHATAFRHFWAPTRLAWWIAVLFAIGSTLFTAGGVGSAWPHFFPSPLGDAAFLNRVFVVGAIFFTGAAWLQWLEAFNGDVAEALGGDARRSWRWFGWRPHNLGYLASAIQLVGTLLFNVDTVDATLPGHSGASEDLLVWTPNMLGCICFLIASYLAYAEVSLAAASFAARSVSWWVAVANFLGSVAFQISALYSFAGSAPASANARFWAGFCTAAGGLCFLVGSYLMIPELFDELEE